MGEQIGILPIAGTIDNITFYKSGDGYMVRKKGGIDAKRIATDRIRPDYYYHNCLHCNFRKKLV